MRIIKKIVLILIIICIMSNSMLIYSLGELVNSLTDNSLHFIINHLHSAKIEEGQENVVIEGYIVPNQVGYEFYIVNQNNRKKRENNRNS